MGYVVLVGDTLLELEGAVAAALANGAKLVGGVAVEPVRRSWFRDTGWYKIEVRYLQAAVFQEEDDDL